MRVLRCLLPLLGLVLASSAPAAPPYSAFYHPIPSEEAAGAFQGGILLGTKGPEVVIVLAPEDQGGFSKVLFDRLLPLVDQGMVRLRVRVAGWGSLTEGSLRAAGNIRTAADPEAALRQFFATIQTYDQEQATGAALPDARWPLMRNTPSIDAMMGAEGDLKWALDPSTGLTSLPTTLYCRAGVVLRESGVPGRPDFLTDLAQADATCPP